MNNYIIITMNNYKLNCNTFRKHVQNVRTTKCKGGTTLVKYRIKLYGILFPPLNKVYFYHSLIIYKYFLVIP